MTKEVFIQVGVTALRSPTGDFLPSVPLYIKADKLKQSGLTQVEENLLRDVSGIFAKKPQQTKAQNEKEEKQEGQNVKIQKFNDK